MSEQKSFLVVDDESVWRRLGRAALEDYGVVHTAETVGEARALLDTEVSWLGLIVDLVLPDGTGFDILEHAGERGVGGMALVLTGHADHEFINRAHNLNAEYLCKPAEFEALQGFGRRAMAYAWTDNPRLAWLIDELARERSLTAREATLVASSVVGLPRRLTANILGVSENTLKAQIRRLLLKCDFPSLDELAEYLLRTALEGSELSSRSR